jgi:hypothetical protein
MARGVTISGRARDTDDRPVPNATVTAFRVTYNNGRPVLAAASTKTTDDRGEYRLIWLPPGEYYIAATPSTGSSAGSRYTRTFHPSATDALQATRLTAVDGRDLPDTDVLLRPISAVKVSGQVINALPGAPSGAQSPFSTFYLLPRDPAVLTDTSPPMVRDSRSERTGTFELRGIPPGSYDLVTTAPDAQGRPFPGRARIDVGFEDIENVAIVVRPGVEVKARVTLDGRPIVAQPAAAPTDPRASIFFGDGAQIPTPASPAISAAVSRGASMSGVRIQLRSRETYPPPFDTAALTGSTLDADGAIVFPNVPESVYTAQISGLPSGAFVSDIREGGVSIYDDGLAVTQRPPGVIDVILSSQGGTVTGSVVDAAGNPAANAPVVLVPEPARRQNAALYRNVRTGNDGRFSITAAPPGNYKVFAWQSVFSIDGTAYMNPEFLASRETRGHAVTVAPGTSSNISVTAIRAE